MRISVLKKIKPLEYRVGLFPGRLRELAHHGHDVIVETHAGMGIGFDNDSYKVAGAGLPIWRKRCLPKPTSS